MNSAKRRIFMVNQGDDSQRFGVGKYIAEMIQETKNRKELCQMVVVTIGVNGISEVQKVVEENITHFDIPKPFLSKEGLLYGLSKQISRGIFLILADHFTVSENDIFHFNSNMQHFLLQKIKESTPANIVYTVHVSMRDVLYHNDEEAFLDEWNDPNCFSLSKKNILAEIENCKLADLVIGLSNNTVEDLRKYYDIPEQKLRRVFNGISTNPPKIDNRRLNAVRKKLGLNEEDFIFLFAGRVNAQKGISDLVKAFEIFYKSGNTNSKLIVLGDGSLKNQLETQTMENNEVIQFLGYVPQKEMYYYYKLADVVVVPSLYDQNPYTIIEAMAYKVPMITTDIDAFIKLKDNLVCIKAPLESETRVSILDLHDKMQLLFEKSELRNRLAENAYQMLLENFSAAQMFDKTYTLQVLNSNILE